eukprot:jgi/Botrbrau1/6523/Bobra.0034s0095.1
MAIFLALPTAATGLYVLLGINKGVRVFVPGLPAGRRVCPTGRFLGTPAAAMLTVLIRMGPEAVADWIRCSGSPYRRGSPYRAALLLASARIRIHCNVNKLALQRSSLKETSALISY